MNWIASRVPRRPCWARNTYPPLYSRLYGERSTRHLAWSCPNPNAVCRIFCGAGIRRGTWWGRVHFNLAENRKDSDAPFAFLATYTTRLSAHTKAQHLPLGEALREY